MENFPQWIFELDIFDTIVQLLFFCCLSGHLLKLVLPIMVLACTRKLVGTKSSRKVVLWHFLTASCN